MERFRWSAPWGAFTIATLAVGLAAAAGLGLSAGSKGITIFWPAAGVAAALVTTAPKSVRRHVVGGVGLGTVLSAFPFQDVHWLQAAGAAIANMVEAQIVGAVLRNRLPAAHRIVRVSDIRALLLGCLYGPAAGALIGGTVTAYTFGTSLGGSMLSWFAADALGLALIGPGALAVISSSRDRVPRAKWVETLNFSFGTLAVLGIAIVLREVTARNFAYLILVPLLLATVHLGQRGTVILTGLTSFIALLATQSGIGPFNVGESPVHPLIAAQIFLVVIQVVLLFVSIETTRRHDVLAEIEGVFDAALDGVLLVDENDTIRRANHSSQEMLGDQLLGRRFKDFLVEPIDSEVMIAHRAVLTRGRRADGTEFWAEVSEGDVIENSNRVRRAVVIRDVTLRIEAQEKVERIRDEFVANMTHELRTPLTSIVGYTEWLLESSADAEAKGDLALIRLSAEKLQDLVDDILDFKRVVGTTASFEPIEFSRLVETVVQMLTPAATKREVSFAVSVSPDLIVQGDPVQLERSVANLVSNAVKFSDPGESVSVELSSDGTDLCLVVADTGIGISADDQARIFERFFRASSALSAGIPGTGLGLSLARDIARSHKGDLTIESSLGVGTTTRLRLPLRTAVLQPAAR